MERAAKTFVEACEWLQANPAVKARLVQLFGEENETSIFWRRHSGEVVEKISKNRQLFAKYARGDFEKYFDVGTAIDATEDRGGLLAYFTDLDLYARVESLEAFKAFLDNVQDLADEEDGFRFGLKQVILSDQKRKLVFVCADTESVALRIQKCVRACLRAESTVVPTAGGLQVTIEGRHYSFEESLLGFNALQEYIRDQDAELATLISLLPRLGGKKFKHTTPDISSCLHASSVAEIAAILKCLPAGLQTRQLNIVVGNNTNIGNTTNITTVENKESAANRWVKNNPPSEYETTTVYYNKYVEANKPQPLPTNKFSSLVREGGWKVVSGNKRRYWMNPEMRKHSG